MKFKETHAKYHSLFNFWFLVSEGNQWTKEPEEIANFLWQYLLTCHAWWQEKREAEIRRHERLCFLQRWLEERKGWEPPKVPTFLEMFQEIEGTLRGFSDHMFAQCKHVRENYPKDFPWEDTITKPIIVIGILRDRLHSHLQE